MSALQVLQPDDNDNEILPITPEMIGKINGTKPSGINSDQVREIKRLLNGYTGGILLEVVDGRVVNDGIHRIRITTYIS